MLIALGILASSIASGPDASHWIGMFTDTGTAQSTLLNATIDSAGNVYFVGTVDQSSLPQKIYLIKYSTAGVILWQRSLKVATGSSDSIGYGVDTDASGNVYIASQAYDNSLVLNTLSIAKYDSSGTLQWQQMLYTSGQQSQGLGVKVAASGNVYVCGSIGAFGATGATVAKYNSSGTLQWQRVIYDGTYGYSFAAIGLDSSENIYASGNGNTGGSPRLLIAKYNSAGTLQFQKTMALGGVTGKRTGSMMDSSGNFYALTSNNVLLKFDASGAILWQRTVTANYSIDSYSTDKSGNVYVVGTDGTPRATTIYKFDSSGTLQWQRKLASTATGNPVYAGGIYADGFNNLYVVGDQRVTTSGAGSNGFFAKLTQDGSLTGNYTISGKVFDYAASALTTSTPSNTVGTSAYANGVGAGTAMAGTSVAGTPTKVPALIQIP